VCSYRTVCFQKYTKYSTRRAKDFLFEKADPAVSNLKTQIIGQVKKTDDADLLQKIYTVLNKTGLVDRIGLVLDRDTDTKGYVKQLVDMIIEVPGTYEEKAAFVKQYPKGYIDIKTMLSGDYVKFEDLIVGGPGAPIEFVRRVFDSLKQVTFGGAKGPGEFGLAVLSPFIKITGKGDLHIGKDVIEVKANAGSSGGRIGTPGLLRSDNIPGIISKYIEADLSAGLNLKQLSALMDEAQLDPKTRKKLATELFTYIFKGETDVSGIISAVVTGDDPNPAFLRANYDLYQKESGFTGMMLINFPAQALKYFKDPVQMASEIYAFQIYLVSANPGFQARQILSQVTLRPIKEITTTSTGAVARSSKKKSATAAAPAPSDKKAVAAAEKKLEKTVSDYTKLLMSKASIIDAKLEAQVSAEISALLKAGVATNQINAAIYKKFPQLVPNQAVNQPAV
jgi:hypothetical protein